MVWQQALSIDVFYTVNTFESVKEGWLKITIGDEHFHGNDVKKPNIYLYRKFVACVLVVTLIKWLLSCIVYENWIWNLCHNKLPSETGQKQKTNMFLPNPHKMHVPIELGRIYTIKATNNKVTNTRLFSTNKSFPISSGSFHIGQLNYKINNSR